MAPLAQLVSGDAYIWGGPPPAPQVGPFVLYSTSGSGTVSRAPAANLGQVQTANTGLAAIGSLNYVGGLYVAFGNSFDQNYATSPDGLSWTVRTFPLTLGFVVRSQVVGSTCFVCPSGTLARSMCSSSDGINWTVGTLSSRTSLHGFQLQINSTNLFFTNLAATQLQQIASASSATNLGSTTTYGVVGAAYTGWAPNTQWVSCLVGTQNGSISVNNNIISIPLVTPITFNFGGIMSATNGSLWAIPTAGTNHAYYSDVGSTWTQTSSTSVPNTLNEVRYLQSQNRYYISANNGVFWANNATIPAWNLIASGTGGNAIAIGN